MMSAFWIHLYREGARCPEEAAMAQAEFAGTELAGDFEIERKDTGIRILLTLLFALIAGLVEAILTLAVVFELLWALITKQPPGLRVRELANRALGYYYRIWRYMTYNESQLPFPFSDFPDALEPSQWSPEQSESEALGVGRSRAGKGDSENEASGI